MKPIPFFIYTPKPAVADVRGLPSVERSSEVKRLIENSDLLKAVFR